MRLVREANLTWDWKESDHRMTFLFLTSSQGFLKKLHEQFQRQDDVIQEQGKVIQEQGKVIQELQSHINLQKGTGERENLVIIYLCL